jgi:predicted RNA-binding protein (virulence factor B family)
MIKIGEIQMLEVLRNTTVGVFLNDSDKVSEDVLLPKKQVPESVEIGDQIEVFIYRDSEDRLIATTKMPKLTLGQIALLRAVDVNGIGAFMDWGLEKDLFLPHKEQTIKVVKGKQYLVSLYLDKSKRLCATMDIYKLLQNGSVYNVGDKVTGILYSIKEDFGAFVAVDNMYHGLISNKEFYGEYECGDEVTARVIKIREDGKLDLSIRQPAYMQIDVDAQAILEKLNDNDGELYLNDSSSPEDIKRQLNMSKNSFKKALGRLFKDKKIEFTQRGIKKI